MKVRVAFYKNTSKPLNALIAGWTWPKNHDTPPYSHAEIGIYGDGWWRYFSSTNRGGARGCRWEDAERVIQNGESWDVYEIDPLREISDIVETFNSVEGAGYDWWGIAGFATPFGLLNSKRKWYCSEVCYYGLTGKWKKRISPRGFYKFIRRHFDVEKIG